MTREDIIRELGWERGWVTESDLLDRVERIVRLAAAHEREACERLVWDTPEPDDEYVSHREAIAAAIRARGEK